MCELGSKTQTHYNSFVEANDVELEIQIELSPKVRDVPAGGQSGVKV